MTDEFSDEHTRAIVLRGGSRLHLKPSLADPGGSKWCSFPRCFPHTHRTISPCYVSLFPLPAEPPGRYFPAVTTLSQHGKYLLMDDAYERAGTIGFRCAGDV